MSRAKIEYNRFKWKVFLDANIILEGRLLTEMPWHELDSEGPILALLTPTALQEIDGKKHDGRLGKIARAFNKQIGPLATGADPLVIKESNPRVELALSTAGPIPWNHYDELDPTDGDSRIVAELIHARDIQGNDRLLLSHDIKPLAFASAYNVRTHHASDDWLRQPEPSPADKEIQRLKQRVNQYETTQPSLEIVIDIEDPQPLALVRVIDLTDSERRTIQRRIHELNPKVNQTRSQYSFSLSHFDHSYDDSYDDRFETYLKTKLPAFMQQYEQNMELVLNQTRLGLKVKNSGHVQAENLLIEVHVTNGWLHERYVVLSPQGPLAPTVRESPLFNIPDLRSTLASPRIGRHEFDFKEKPNRSPSFSVMCEDFRHGQVWSFEGVVGLDARAEQATTIFVTITAANLRGSVELDRTIEKKIDCVHISKLVNAQSLKFDTKLPMEDVLERGQYDVIDWGIAEED